MIQDLPQLTTTSDTYPLDAIDETTVKDGVVTLWPLTMRIFNSQGIYSPSKLKPKKTVSYETFLSQYADYSIKMRVCFDENPAFDTLFQHSKLVTAYGLGLDGCYIITEHRVETYPLYHEE